MSRGACESPPRPYPRRAYLDTNTADSAGSLTLFTASAMTFCRQAFLLYPYASVLVYMLGQTPSAVPRIRPKSARAPEEVEKSRS
jgi:hypothetical protein